MSMHDTYPIGQPKTPWGQSEKALWLAQQTVKRCYHADVIAKLAELPEDFRCEQYGCLSYINARYPLYLIKSAHWHVNKPNVLITGGVHGYETSGVQGAIRFLQSMATQYTDSFNFVVIPCVSPWAYETINRWNPSTVDPNRAFKTPSPALEAEQVMTAIAALNVAFTVHIDLHETTDTDNSEFRPALAARDAIHQDVWDIPDGFYLVGNTEKPAHAFQQAIINAVKHVTHIAPADVGNRIIGEPISQHGVINYEIKKLGLCASMTNAAYTTTTEVYPDSPKVNDEKCIEAQVAAITGGLEYVRHNLPS